MAKQEAICLAGNGECPRTCPVFPTGKRVFEAIPIGADLNQVNVQFRRATILADASNHAVSVADVARLQFACERERPALQTIVRR